MTTTHDLAPALSCVISDQLGPADRQALLDLFERSSPRTRRERFHHALAVFPESYLDDIVEGRQLALGARDACDPENHGRVFGVASAASMGAGTAEFAVWVDDAWQGHGVGTLLTKALFEALGRAGIRTAIGIAEPGNPAVRRMISKAAQRYSINAHDDVLVISVPLGT